MPSATPLTVIVPWCDRDEIAVTLTRNEPELKKINAEILLVNCGGDMAELLKLHREHGWNSVKILDANLPVFNKSFALNVGIYCSSAPVVSVLDADVLITADLVESALAQVQDETFITVEWMHESSNVHPVSGLNRIAGLTTAIRSHFMELKFGDGTERKVRTYRFNELTGSRSGIGLIFARKEHLLSIGGYNSALKRWGWEDNDVHLRLLWSGKLRHVEMGSVVHLSHGDDRRALMGISQQAALKENIAVCLERYAQNDLQGTYLADIAEWKNHHQAAKVGD